MDRLHIALDGRALCGRAIDDEDVYADAAGLTAWNDGPLERCRKCAGALTAGVRRAPRHAAAAGAVESEVR